MIDSNFVRPEETKARANKTGINFMVFISIFVENFLDFLKSWGRDDAILQLNFLTLYPRKKDLNCSN